jgi:hypothetical protein
MCVKYELQKPAECKGRGTMSSNGVNHRLVSVGRFPTVHWEKEAHWDMVLRTRGGKFFL